MQPDAVAASGAGLIETVGIIDRQCAIAITLVKTLTRYVAGYMIDPNSSTSVAFLFFPGSLITNGYIVILYRNRSVVKVLEKI